MIFLVNGLLRWMTTFERNFFLRSSNMKRDIKIVSFSEVFLWVLYKLDEESSLKMICVGLQITTKIKKRNFDCDFCWESLMRQKSLKSDKIDVFFSRPCQKYSQILRRFNLLLIVKIHILSILLFNVQWFN